MELTPEQNRIRKLGMHLNKLNRDKPEPKEESEITAQQIVDES